MDQAGHGAPAYIIHQSRENAIMNRRALLAMLATAILVALAMITIPNRASAQWNGPNCCTYTVDVNGVIDACFPFKGATFWSDGTSDSHPYSSNGITTWSIPPGPVPCPPAPQFKGISIDGGPVVGPGQTKKVNTAAGCCLIVGVGLDAGGCVYIKISPCP